ncbi:hypothetical protein PHMEG_00016661 [Phytophthora megakarya]|uniref:Uncharacterized protein n=1 Tax=Phytophthora megakarya TaxID=4795 RepID=A0A225VYQ1_9STRA|nr:hypothetical protein PHMEG_00016661 [Phytophthora megakarya]
MLRHIQEIHAHEDQPHECSTVEQLRDLAAHPVKEDYDRVRATVRLYGKALFARGVHLSVVDNCSRAAFVESSNALQGGICHNEDIERLQD